MYILVILHVECFFVMVSVMIFRDSLHGCLKMFVAQSVANAPILVAIARLSENTGSKLTAFSY